MECRLGSVFRDEAGESDGNLAASWAASALGAPVGSDSEDKVGPQAVMIRSAVLFVGQLPIGWIDHGVRLANDACLNTGWRGTLIRVAAARG